MKLVAFVFALTILVAVLKACDVITASWWCVTYPALFASAFLFLALAIPAAFFGAMLVVAAIVNRDKP